MCVAQSSDVLAKKPFVACSGSDRCLWPLLQTIMDTQEQLTSMVAELSHESSAQANLRIVSSIQVTWHSSTADPLHKCPQTWCT
jgi:hypothetical protein